MYARSRSCIPSVHTFYFFLCTFRMAFFFPLPPLFPTPALPNPPAFRPFPFMPVCLCPASTAHSRSFGVFCTIGSSRFCRLAAMMRPFISASREIASFDLPRTDQAFLIKTDQIRSACQIGVLPAPDHSFSDCGTGSAHAASLSHAGLVGTYTFSIVRGS